MSVLVLNVGSSSLKFGLYTQGPHPRRLYGGHVSGFPDEARFEADGIAAEPRPDFRDAADAARFVFSHVRRRGPIEAVAHRIVHGGSAHARPTRLTPTVMRSLRSLTGLAPLHQPLAHDVAEAAMRELPDAVHVACFDTSFHATLHPHASVLPVPAGLRPDGLRRYGFHGLAYDDTADWLRREKPRLAEGLVVALHLGSGVSLCAMRRCRSVATTMGATPLDGVPMGTRSGSLDPGMLLFLLREGHVTAPDLEEALYRQSGLKALSGLSSDVRTLHASNEEAAAFALEVFAYRVAEAAAGLTVALGGLDALVFSGGIGANDPVVRGMIVHHLAHLGEFEVHHRTADEERVAARHAVSVIEGHVRSEGIQEIPSC